MDVVESNMEGPNGCCKLQHMTARPTWQRGRGVFVYALPRQRLPLFLFVLQEESGWWIRDELTHRCSMTNSFFMLHRLLTLTPFVVSFFPPPICCSIYFVSFFSSLTFSFVPFSFNSNRHWNDTKMTLKWHQNDTKMTPKWHQNDTKMTPLTKRLN